MAKRFAQRDWRPHNGSTRVALASLAALAALLVAWFAPLPRLVLSDEEKAAARMPDDRAAVAAAQSAFQKAEIAYKAYISTNNIGAALDGLDHAVQLAKASPTDLSLHAPILAASPPVLSYLSRLQAHAQAGETYFGALSHYDDELMAWTRSLGSESDALQSDTWPIVEYLKLYPPPTGESTDYPNITAAQVASASATLQSHLSAIGTGPAAAPSATNGPPPLDGLTADLASIRQAGRSVEYREGLNDKYNQLLSQYDKSVQATSNGSNIGSLSSGRVALASGLDLLLGVICVGGIAALFVAKQTEPVRELR
jgi:putative inorganic carbon (HCO3(-)) transporter